MHKQKCASRQLSLLLEKKIKVKIKSQSTVLLQFYNDVCAIHKTNLKLIENSS